MFVKLKAFRRDESGATIIEAAATMLTFFVILFGIIEFSFLYYQWNAATKAVQFGARMAAVSSPIPSGFRAYSGVTNTVLAGNPLPDATFNIECIATDASGSSVNCTGVIPAGMNATAVPNALQALVYGRTTAGNARTACDFAPRVTAAEKRTSGMCNFMFGNRLQANNVVVRYNHTGLGYAGRPGGPVPTITVSLRNVTYDFIFLGGLMNFTPLTMPGFATTVTGEDLNVTGS